MPDYRAQSCTTKGSEDIKREWSDLQKRADCSFFQSWGWVGTWLEKIAGDLDPLLVKVWFGDELVGLGLFVSKQFVRHQVIHSNAMFLNEYPFDGRNMVIEYNGLLADKKHKQAVYRATIKHLLDANQNIDEFFFSGLDENEDNKLLQESYDGNTCNLIVREKSLTWFVELDAFEQGVNAFLETLSKNRRAQIRRSIKAYEGRTSLTLEEANNTEEALMFFNGLEALHTTRWKSKGGQGCFANPLWENFHRTLIHSRFSKGEIQLLRVNGSDGVIGYLYNFIWRKRVYVLQTGFKIEEDKRLMPGYVVHVLAIAYNKQKGMEVYDLMHGDSLYKRIICNQTRTLYWVVLQRHRLKFVFEKLAVNTVRGLRRVLPGRA